MRRKAGPAVAARDTGNGVPWLGPAPHGGRTNHSASHGTSAGKPPSRLGPLDLPGRLPRATLIPYTVTMQRSRVMSEMPEDGRPSRETARRAASPEVGGTGGAASVTALRPMPPSGSPRPAPPSVTSFDRRELSTILSIYGRQVAAGEWRDYAIDCLKDRAVFSIFRRASEVPLYRIEKDPRLARRQGAYCVIAPGGRIVKRGHELAQVLKVLEGKPRLAVV